MDQFVKLDFLTGGGEMERLIRTRDWSDSPIGRPETWPQSLRTTVSLCLASNFPIDIIWGPGHTQIYNGGYKVICGGGHPAFLGMNFAVSWASAWPAIGQPFERALAGETSFLENQRIFLERNGYLEETFFTFSFSPIRDETGGIGGVFHPVTETTATMLGERRTRAVRDLTARLAPVKTAEQVFAEAAATLAGFAFDLPFVLFYQREAAADGAGYALAARTGLNAHQPASPPILHGSDGEPWPLAGLLAGGGPAVVDGLPGRFGPAFCGPYDEAPERAVVLPVGTPGAAPAVVVIAGVSPRLPFDDAYRGFLDLIVAALGAALANVHAYQAERQRAEALAAIDRAKTQFFSNVSHEFRTPLTLMLGPLDDALAEAAALPPAQRERLLLAQRNATRLLRLVNALLDFSRIEAGRTKARFRPVDLAAVTAELASNFRSACDRAGLRLLVACPTLDGPVHVDVDMWEKIVLNLLSNAFKFTLSGSIHVSLARVGDAAELIVRDTGVGIPAAELPRLFERFHRIEGQRGRTHEGTGIGLALVEELVRLHGGAIAATSTTRAKGHGTRFRVTIPLGTAHLPAARLGDEAGTDPAGETAHAYVDEALRWLPAATSDAGDAPPPAGPACGLTRIVLADDNADMRGYVARILSQAGYAVEAVGDGHAALAAARRQPPDLVLTDVMMPGLDGFGLLRALRADASLEGLLVILLSARAGEEARVEGLAAGADDYLVKPFTANELRARIDGAIGLARLRREAAGRERDLRASIATERGRATLREREQQFAYALTAGRLGSWALDPATGLLIVSEIGRTIFGFGAAERLDSYDQLAARLHPDDRARHQDAVTRAAQTGEPLDIECRVLPREGGIAWVEMRGQTVAASDGAPERVAGVALDVTARKQAEGRQKLLLDELNHRVKNTLATVQSIVHQTQRNARTPAAFNESLTARIVALAQAHDLLTHASWEGASLADVIGRTLALYVAEADGDGRVQAAGPPVQLSPNAAVTLNMAFHELATNAAKYGALSVASGRVSVTWTQESSAQAPLLEILWREADGPAVTAPLRRGFGSRLLERGLSAELGGEVRLDFASGGLCCRMRLPVSTKITLAAA